MRFLFRWAFRLFLVAVVLVVALVLLKDTLIKSFTERQLRAQTGLDAKIDRLEAGLLSPTLTIENFKLYNTAEFGGSPLVDVPELPLEWSPAALVTGKLHFKLVRVHLNELNIVASKDGRTNIVGFVSELEKLSSTNANNRVKRGLEFAGIDVLNLTLDRMKYSNLKQPGKTLEVEFGLKNEVLTNVKTLPDLSTLVLNILFQRGITITRSGDRTSVTINPKGPQKLTPSKARLAQDRSAATGAQPTKTKSSP